MKIFYFTLLILALGSISCEKKQVEANINTSESDGYKFSIPLDVYDESGENRASLEIASNNETALKSWIERYDLKLTFSNEVFDQILDSAPYSHQESSGSESESSLGSHEGVALFVNEIHADVSLNEYSLSIVDKHKESIGSLDKDADLDLVILYSLDVVFDKRFHNGRICWNPANATSTVPNSVKYRWRKKWRQFFRVWKDAYSGAVDEDTQCDEYYYDGYRIRNFITSNYLNFTLSQRKYSDHTWQVFYGE